MPLGPVKVSRVPVLGLKLQLTAVLAFPVTVAVRVVDWPLWRLVLFALRTTHGVGGAGHCARTTPATKQSGNNSRQKT